MSELFLEWMEWEFPTSWNIIGRKYFDECLISYQSSLETNNHAYKHFFIRKDTTIFFLHISVVLKEENSNTHKAKGKRKYMSKPI
jgi:hypothetical protein